MFLCRPTPGLDLDLMTHHLCGLLQRFGSHEGMGDTGRAGCHRNDFHIGYSVLSTWGDAYHISILACGQP